MQDDEDFLGGRAVIRGTVRGGPLDGDDFMLPASVTAHGVVQEAVLSLCINGVRHIHALATSDDGNLLVYRGRRAQAARFLPVLADGLVDAAMTRARRLLRLPFPGARTR